MDIFTKDELRQSVEAASGGKQTIFRTAKGAPSYFNVIPAFKLEDISPELGTGVHPAFLVGGIEKNEIFIGTYQAVIQDGEAVSLPDQDPCTSIDFNSSRAACLAAGPGFHLMTNWEWAALALWCLKNGHGDLHGNTNNGKSHVNPKEVGRISKYGRTFTGSGPDSWRHDGTPFGIADLVGNVWEWNDGLKLIDGKIIMPPDNNFTLPEAAWLEAGAVIDFPDGDIQISDVITERDYDGCYFKDATVKDGYAAPIALKQALLQPMNDMAAAGYYWADNTEGFEALPVRGGSWSYASNAGLAALHLYYRRSFVFTYIGFRPAFIG